MENSFDRDDKDWVPTVPDHVPEERIADCDKKCLEKIKRIMAGKYKCKSQNLRTTSNKPEKAPDPVQSSPTCPRTLENKNNNVILQDGSGEMGGGLFGGEPSHSRSKSSKKLN